MARLKDEDFKTWVEAFEDAFVDSETFGRLAQISSDGKTLDLIAGTRSTRESDPSRHPQGG